MNMKTKLGISAVMLATLTYAFGLLGGYVALALLAGYILLCEPEVSLKKHAVKAVLLCVVFDLVAAVIGLIPNAMTLVDNLCNIFGGGFHIAFISNVIYFITYAFSLLEKVLFLAFIIVAWLGKEVKIPLLDDFVEKHL